MKIEIISSQGIGDAAILHIVSHHLARAGHETHVVTPHDFGRWRPNPRFEGAPEAYFLQHDNTARSESIRHSDKQVYTFYGSHSVEKHGPLREGLDYVCDQNKTMVENVVLCLQELFQIAASPDNGFRAPLGLTHRKFLKRVVIHPTSGNPNRNWPEKKIPESRRMAPKRGVRTGVSPPIRLPGRIAELPL